MSLSCGSRTTLAVRAWAATLNVPRLHSTRAVPRANAAVTVLMSRPPCQEANQRAPAHNGSRCAGLKGDGGEHRQEKAHMPKVGQRRTGPRQPTSKLSPETSWLALHACTVPNRALYICARLARSRARMQLSPLSRQLRMLANISNTVAGPPRDWTARPTNCEILTISGFGDPVQRNHARYRRSAGCCLDRPRR